MIPRLVLLLTNHPLFDPSHGDYTIKPLGSLNLDRFFVLENKDHRLVFSIQSVNILQMSVCCLRVDGPYKLQKRVVSLQVLTSQRPAYWNKEGVEHHPNQIKTPADVGYSGGSDLHNNIV